jgi:hypothetical protein
MKNQKVITGQVVQERDLTIILGNSAVRDHLGVLKEQLFFLSQKISWLESQAEFFLLKLR